MPFDFEKYLEKLREWFPHETAAIDTYFVESRKAYLYGLLLYFRGVANDHAERFETYTVTEKLVEHFHDPRLKAILMADCPHWGSLPSRTSYLFNAMLRMSYFLGNYYPLGGSQQFADDLGNAFHARGGRCPEVCASGIHLDREWKGAGGADSRLVEAAAGGLHLPRARGGFKCRCTAHVSRPDWRGTLRAGAH